ncbi:MAG: tetratricopeptide repeat protein [Methylacidiphilales bacterium]|nr:tetratricopeptide repeat protein [Candidatus Methylacidiphilales bacterium]MDW8349909.1 tetratricopeptide repeat protein [Verrucomicrobiae bacterium]
MPWLVKTCLLAITALPCLSLPAHSQSPPPTTPTSSPLQEITLHNPALEQFEKAQKLFREGQYPAALQEYIALSRQFPSFSKIEEVLYRIAECYRLLNRPNDALSAFKYSLEKYPDGIYSIPTYLRIAQLQIATAQTQEAIKTLIDLRQRPNLPPDTHHTTTLALAQAYLKQNQTSQALPLLEELINIPSQSPFKTAALEVLADYNEKLNQPEAALEIWQKLISEAPPNDTQILSKAHARAGFLQWKLKNLPAALASLRQALDLAPTSPATPLIRAALIQLYADLNQPAEAIALYLPHSQTLPESMLPDVLKKVAQSYMAINSPTEAISVLDTLLEKFPTHPIAPQAAFERIRARSQINPDSLDADTAAFLRQYPTSPLAYSVRYLRAAHLQQQKKYNEAIPLWEQLSLQKNNLPPQLSLSNILLQLGEAYLRTERYDSAATTLTQYLDLNPQLPDPLPILQHIANAWQKANRYTQAINTWKRITSIAPPLSTLHQTALEQLAALYSITKQENEKIATLLTLYNDYPNSTLRPTAAFVLAQKAIQEKQYPQATSLLEEARTLDPKTWDARATYQLLALAQITDNAEAAIQHLSHYTELKKNNPDLPPITPATYYWLGDKAYQRKDYPNAKNFLEQFLATCTKEDEIAATTWQLAKINIELHSWRDALTHLERFARLRPDQARTSEYLLAQLRTLYHTANFDRAAAIAEQILKQEPEGEYNLQAQYWLAEIHYSRQNYAEAARAFATLSYLHSDATLTPLILYRAAQSFEKAGDVKSAAEWRLRLRTRYPDYRPPNS